MRPAGGQRRRNLQFDRRPVMRQGPASFKSDLGIRAESGRGQRSNDERSGSPSGPLVSTEGEGVPRAGLRAEALLGLAHIDSAEPLVEGDGPFIVGERPHEKR